MPEFRFVVRHNECDAYGHLNNVSYVRYLAEALLHRGVKPALRQRIGGLTIEYVRPAYHGDTVTLRLAMVGGDAPGSVLPCEFRRAGSEEIIASGAVELHGEDSSVALPNTASWSVPAMAYTQRYRVTWRDLDVTRRVAEATLLDLADGCGLGVITAHRWPPERMVREGFAIILRRREAVFSIPAQLGDELEIATWVTDVKRVSAMRHYTIRRIADGALLARTDTLGVWVDLATGRPIRIPEQLLDDFAANFLPTG